MTGKGISEALDYHARGRPGKLEVRPTKPTTTQSDLSLAYTPGVAEPCREIAANPDDAFVYTNKGNLVAVVSNGTAVLGLGDIGALAGKPVMEGKGVLFKRFADIDVYDIEVDSRDPAEVIRFCELLSPTVGGINLEDIKAPECFEIETALRDRLDIPVFHDDQHGTAIIAAAAMLNALEITGRRIEDTTFVFSGAGAAGIATARFFLHLGARKENVVLIDSRGVIRSDRPNLTATKAEWATDRDIDTLEEALRGADAFVGVSAPDTVTPGMLQSMADQPIVFALANPDPEIPYEVARETRPDAIVATGRSDYPNQVNNVLGFPFIFRGALDVRARSITEGMKVAAAQALADLAKREVPDSVLRTYGLGHLEFGPDYLIPKPFDPRVLWYVAPAVAQAAGEEGVARFPLDDLDAYKNQLRSRFEVTFGLMHPVTVKAQERPLRVVYPHGADLRIVRAARRVAEEGIAAPVLLGDAAEIRAVADDFSVDLGDVEIVDPSGDRERQERYARILFDARQRKGMTPDDARRWVGDLNYMAALMLREGDADAVLGGLNLAYPETLRPAIQVLPLEEGRTIVHGVYIVVANGHPYFIADSAVNPTPSAEHLAEIALATADLASRYFDLSPRVAFVSYSNFGSAQGEEPARVQQAVQICREREPDLPLDGEMQADIAVNPDLLHKRHPFNRLGTEANVLVFPNLTAANSAYKLLGRLGGAEIIGPILSGVSKSVHVLQRDVDVGDIVNLTAIAVLDAQHKAG
ncbi:MAG TPA: NADP-dependent malic enzyme [Acidimicrobiia bacterium]|nr:NADP-dependent malic enzyme [Acidimicrobiia bacterium]